MTSKEFTAYGKRPSISDTCIFIHFNQRLLKTQGNISVPLKITSFSSCFPYCLGVWVFSEKKTIWYNHSLLWFYSIFTFIFEQITFKGVKNKGCTYYMPTMCHKLCEPISTHEALYSLQDCDYFACSTNEKTQRCTNICSRSNSK